MILLGDSERPFGISAGCRMAPRFDIDSGGALTVERDDGTSRMLSERPVVGSLVKD